MLGQMRLRERSWMPGRRSTARRKKSTPSTTEVAVQAVASPVAALKHREMVAPMYQSLLAPVYWVRFICMELLHASSRLKKNNRIETIRPSNGLKIMCSPKALGEEPTNTTADNKGLTHWNDSASHVQSLYV